MAIWPLLVQFICPQSPCSYGLSLSGLGEFRNGLIIRAGVLCSQIKELTMSDTLSVPPLLLPPPGPVLRTEINRVWKHCHRARKKSLPATLTIHEWLDLLNRYQWRCAFCGGPFETIEHVNPLGRGGGTTAQNCVPACRICNDARSWLLSSLFLLDMVKTAGKWPFVQDLVLVLVHTLQEEGVTVH